MHWLTTSALPVMHRLNNNHNNNNNKKKKNKNNNKNKNSTVSRLTC